MISSLDTFVQHGSDVGDPIMGEDSLVIDGGPTLTGVWSEVSFLIESANGGPQVQVDAQLDILTSSAPARTAVLNKKGTAKGDRFMVASYIMGEVITHVYLQHATQGLAQ